MKCVVVYDGSDGKHRSMEMECLGCGATTLPHLPIPVSQWLWIAKGFEREHAACARQRGKETG